MFAREVFCLCAYVRVVSNFPESPCLSVDRSLAHNDSYSVRETVAGERPNDLSVGVKSPYSNAGFPNGRRSRRAVEVSNGSSHDGADPCRVFKDTEM